MSITFPPFKMLSEGCIYDKFKYEIQTVEGGFISYFMSSRTENLVFKIKTKEMSFAGNYSLKLIGSLNPYLIKEFPFTLSVIPSPNTAAPKFLGTLMSPIEAVVGQESLYPLPFTKDPDGDPYFLEIIAPTFVKYSKPFLVVYSLDQSDLGTHKVVINLTDIHPVMQRSRLYSIDLKVKLF